jgi:hypothetical protein
MSTPKVTVLMSVYNAERFVAQAVDSVLSQTFTNFEFLIFEDRSTDSSRDILRSYDDPRIRLVENTENLGLTRNLAAGMTMARGEFIARMDADDVCVPTRLEQQLAYLDAHPDVSVLGSAVTFFDESGKEFVAHQPLEHEEIKCTLFYGFTMLHPSVMMRKDDFEKHGLNYDPAFRVSQDHDLWTRAIRVLRFSNLYEPLLQMREHPGKIGRTRKPLQQEFSDLIRRRQLLELGIMPTPHQLTLLAEHETNPTQWTVEDCREFERMLLQIFAANLSNSVFHQDALSRIGISRFRGTCRQLLLLGNPAGRYYWASEIRREDSPTIKEIAGLAARSLKTFCQPAQR